MHDHHLPSRSAGLSQNEPAVVIFVTDDALPERYDRRGRQGWRHVPYGTGVEFVVLQRDELVAVGNPGGADTTRAPPGHRVPPARQLLDAGKRLLKQPSAIKHQDTAGCRLNQPLAAKLRNDPGDGGSN